MGDNSAYSAGMLDVISGLREICHEARIDKKRHRSEVAAMVKKADSAIGGFERGDRSPPLEDINGYVEAYAFVTGISELELWKRAIKRAQDVKPQVSAFDPDAAAAGATAAARRAGRSLEAQERSTPATGRSRKKGSPRQARK